ncbi:MAG: PAS domain-containing protein [Chloroflexota bacterium]|nr:PAS domain-containing protein [Chloroflexota bacterium]
MDQSERGVLLLDDQRVFVAANDDAAELLGTTPGELIGRRADEFMPVVARALYPIAWRGFVLRGSAAGEYAALRSDGTHAHLAYVGFANRPVRGLHFFVLEALPGAIDQAALAPRVQAADILIGADLAPEIQRRLAREADRQEWRLPIGSGGQRAVVAALFDHPEAALDALNTLRSASSFEGSIASAAGATPDAPLTLLAGRIRYDVIGRAVAAIRACGGRVMASVDERYA